MSTPTFFIQATIGNNRPWRRARYNPELNTADAPEKLQARVESLNNDSKGMLPEAQIKFRIADSRGREVK